jgi:lantibiotic leader peptide-processing serine protease
MKRINLMAVLVGTVAGLAACADTVTQPAGPEIGAPSFSVGESGSVRFVIRGTKGVLPPDLAAQVAAQGGTLEKSFPQIGIAFVLSEGNFSSARLAGVESIVADQMFELAGPARTQELEEEGELEEAVASIGDTNPFYFIQWAPAAVQAPEAWNAGFTGQGVRVAVLDGGLYGAHPDLAANVDVSASASFVPGQAWNFDTGTFWHGTHVAGIIGAAANSVGVIGIAPRSTLIGVKVLHNGSGQFSWVIEGIMHAARPVSEGGAGAQVINMSLGAVIPSGHGNVDPALKQAVKELVQAIDMATTYAWDMGVTVVAAAGNDAINFDSSKDVVVVPSSNARVISVASTGPLGWAYGETNFSRQASYTNSGKSNVTLAAPGGDFAYPGNEFCTLLNSTGTGPASITNRCWVFDMYLSTSRGTTAAGSYSWAAGTSMASPVVAGIAALIIERNGGAISPALVQQRMQQGAEDLGKKGKDEVYGHGWVNAYRSVMR